MRKMGWLAAALLLIAPSAAAAGTPFERNVVCPLDGSTFSFTDTMSYSTMGTWLDGMPIMSWITPLPFPQCPGSRFPVYQEEFTAAEITAAKALVETPEYQAIKDESSYYVLHYVISRLQPDRPPIDNAWLLLSATWQVRDDPARYAAYVGQVVPLLDASVPSLREERFDDWVFMQTILANLARQVGDFDGATRRLDALPATIEGPELRVGIALTRELVTARDTSPREWPRVDAD